MERKLNRALMPVPNSDKYSASAAPCSQMPTHKRKTPPQSGGASLVSYDSDQLPPGVWPLAAPSESRRLRCAIFATVSRNTTSSPTVTVGLQDGEQL